MKRLEYIHKIKRGKDIGFIIIMVSLINPLLLLAQEGSKVKTISYGTRLITVALPKGYSYFQDSRYKDIEMKDFTKNSLSGLLDIEVLVPTKLDPIINIIGFSEFIELKLEQEDFKDYKNYVKSNVTKSSFDNLADSLLTDTNFIQAIGANLKISKSFMKTIYETDTRLVSCLFLNGTTNDKTESALIITNYLYLKETILIIRFLYKKIPENLAEPVKFQNDYVSKFIISN